MPVGRQVLLVYWERGSVGLPHQNFLDPNVQTVKDMGGFICWRSLETPILGNRRTESTASIANPRLSWITPHSARSEFDKRILTFNGDK